MKEEERKTTPLQWPIIANVNTIQGRANFRARDVIFREVQEPRGRHVGYDFLERKTRVPKISLLFSKLKRQKSPETTTDTQDVSKFY